MAQNSNWATIEGGVTNTFPLSINRETYWTALRKGECDYQDMTTRDYRGVFSYGTKPSASPEFFIKDFRFKEDITDTATQTEAVFHWGRWWRINPTTKYRLEYSRLDLDEPSFAPDTSGQEWRRFNTLMGIANAYNRAEYGWYNSIKASYGILGISGGSLFTLVVYVDNGFVRAKFFGPSPSNWDFVKSNKSTFGPAGDWTQSDFESEELWNWWTVYSKKDPTVSSIFVPAWITSGTGEGGAGRIELSYWGFLDSTAKTKARQRVVDWQNSPEGQEFQELLKKFSVFWKLERKEDSLEPKNLYYEYSIIPPSQADEGYIDFINDSKEPIRLLAFNGVGQLYVLKQTCGYVVSNAHFGPTEWRRTTPNYSIGTEYTGSGVTNAIIDGAVAVAFRDRSQPGLAPRHYLWNGQDFGLELTGDVRKLSDTSVTYAEVNWPSRLIIFGPLVYELDEKRIFYYSGKTKASLTTRPYFAANFNAQTLRRIAFICDGNAGSFDAIVEYGQSFQNLQKTRSFKVKVNNNTKNRFRHLWLLDIPVTCRVWRLKIENMTGIGITQIDADVSFVDSPDLPDGTE